MKISIKFFGVSYNTGKSKTFKHEFETGVEFSDITKKVSGKLKEILLKYNPKLTSLPDDYTIDVFEQAMDWVDERDNTDIIHQYELQSITNYKVVSVGLVKQKSAEKKFVQEHGDKRIAKGSIYHIQGHDIKAEQVLVFLDSAISDPQLKLDMLAVYKKMYKSIKSLGYKKQVSIVLDSTAVAYTAATATLAKLSDYNKELNALPSFVWKAAIYQDEVATSVFVNQFKSGKLSEKGKLILSSYEDRYKKLQG